ncbi:YcaO-like family protein [Candidatus Pacearchaeota archaeon]|nr:YcaO-like family protein [Candidatus Pacearchaeota archaeon]
MNTEQVISALHSTGLSSLEEKMPVITDEPKIPGYFCFVSDKAKRKYNVEETFGQGFDLELGKARLKSVAEMLERLCLNNPVNRDLIASRKFFNGRMVDPALFCCYSKEQLPNRDKVILESRKEEYVCMPAKDLFSNQEIFIPNQMIYLSTEYDKEYPLRKEQTSSGAALGPIGTGFALRGGLLELIERDACISSYLSQRDIPQIIGFDGEIQKLMDYLRRYRLETHILDVTTDIGAPTVIAVIIDRTGIGDAVNLGSRTELEYTSAIRGALLESLQCRGSSRISRQLNGGLKDPKEDEIITMSDRFEYWAHLKRIDDILPWLNRSRKVQFEGLRNVTVPFERVLERFREKGFDIYVADITLPEIREAGFEAVKVVVPELLPLYLDERAKALYSVHHGSIPNNPKLKPHPLT